MGSSSSSGIRGTGIAVVPMTISFSLVEGVVFFFKEHKSSYLCQCWILVTPWAVVGLKLAPSVQPLAE